MTRILIVLVTALALGCGVGACGREDREESADSTEQATGETRDEIQVISEEAPDDPIDVYAPAGESTVDDFGDADETAEIDEAIREIGEGVREETAEVIDDAGDAAEDAGDAVEEAGDAVEEAVDEAAEEAEDEMDG
jgi:hypothetical protein